MSEARQSISETFASGTRLLRDGYCEEALLEFQVVYAAAETSDDLRLMASSLCEMAWACYKLGRAEQALECAMGAKWLWQRVGNSGEQARAMAVEAIAFLDLGVSDEAFEAASEAVTLAEVSGDKSILAFAVNAKAIVLTICRQVDLGVELSRQAVRVAADLGNPAAQAYYLANLGFCHAKRAEMAADLGDSNNARGERDLAITFGGEAIDLAESSGDQWTLRVALGNNAEMLSLLGRHDEALALMERSAAVPCEPGVSLRIHQLYSLGEVLRLSGDLTAAREACAQALQLADESGIIDHQVNASGKLSEVLEALGEHAEALRMHKRFHALYVQQSGELAGRRAKVEEIRSETRKLRANVMLLANQALTDPLTGVANRRSFDHILNRLAGTPFAVAILDLDHFKLVNDRFSHIVGDAVLRRLATTLSAQIGTHGHVARLGGEEFALVFPGAPEATAAAFCEGIRVAVQSIGWSDIAPDLAVTVSIGLASGTGDEPAGVLMQIADNRLYAAKAAGRNRVMSGDPDATGSRRQA